MKSKFDPQLPFNQWPLLRQIDWPVALFLVATPLLAITLAPIHLYQSGMTWELFTLLMVYTVLTTLTIGSGYHRLFSHKAYETNSLMKFLYLFFASAQFQGPALKWCSDHRVHHKYVDTDADPYSIKRGFFFAHIGWLFLKPDPRGTIPFEKDLERDTLVYLQYKYYVPLAIFTGFFIPTLLGALAGDPWGGFVWIGIVRVVLTQHTTFFINSLAHTWGRRPFDAAGSATDSFIVAVFTYGEGYHNFHHKFQGDYRNGIRWYDWDPNKWLIRSLSFVGMARSLKRIPANEILKARLNTQGELLLAKGAPAEKVESLRTRIQAAQASLRKMREDYHGMRENWNQREQVQKMKADLAIAHLEFKMAYRQWKAYYRALKA